MVHGSPLSQECEPRPLVTQKVGGRVVVAASVLDVREVRVPRRLVPLLVRSFVWEGVRRREERVARVRHTWEVHGAVVGRSWERIGC